MTLSPALTSTTMKGFIQVDDPGAVGAHLFWLHPVTGIIKQRDATNTSWLAVGGGAPSGAAGGALTGTYPNPTLAPFAAPAVDDTYSGLPITLTAAETTTQWQVGRINASGKVALADADTLATASAVVLATSALATDAAGTYLVLGLVRNDAWNWTPGGLLYLSTTAGDMVQTEPSGADDVIQILGVALTADIILFNPSLVQVEHV